MHSVQRPLVDTSCQGLKEPEEVEGMKHSEDLYMTRAEDLATAAMETECEQMVKVIWHVDQASVIAQEPQAQTPMNTLRMAARGLRPDVC